jgi:hypothetical protein
MSASHEPKLVLITGARFWLTIYCAAELYPTQSQLTSAEIASLADYHALSCAWIGSVAS